MRKLVLYAVREEVERTKVVKRNRDDLCAANKVPMLKWQHNEPVKLQNASSIETCRLTNGRQVLRKTR